MRFGPRAAAITSLANPENEVAIYIEAPCEGAPLKTGTLEELEGAGIRVEVAQDHTTTFYATQTETEGLGGTSDCSKGLPYYESSTFIPPEEEEPPAGSGGGEEPSPGGSSGGSGTSGGSGGGVSPGVPVTPAAPSIHISPGGPANDNTPLVVGSAPGSDRVKIYASDHCSGIPAAEVLAGQLPPGAPVQVPDNSMTIFTAIGVSGGDRSKCSEAVAYVEDSTAPVTRITMGPGGKTRKRKVVFRFTDTTSNAPGTTFRCKVDQRKWRPCFSPFKLKHLSYRRHTLRIIGTDTAGNRERKPTKRRFKVVRHR